jgi:murein DD-endopeptidase MepM/ murein hydrolase activator NlpD
MHNPLAVMKIRSFQCGRYDPISNTFGVVRAHDTQSHQGWDLLAVPGTDVYAVADGELTTCPSTSYGNTATLKFTYRRKAYFAFYAHLSSASRPNAFVAEGSIIGKSGMTGNARTLPVSEAHLHFEIRTIRNPGGHSGILGRIDPGQILGYSVYTCST